MVGLFLQLVVYSIFGWKNQGVVPQPLAKDSMTPSDWANQGSVDPGSINQPQTVRHTQVCSMYATYSIVQSHGAFAIWREVQSRLCSKGRDPVESGVTDPCSDLTASLPARPHGACSDLQMPSRLHGAQKTSIPDTTRLMGLVYLPTFIGVVLWVNGAAYMAYMKCLRIRKDIVLGNCGGCW